MRLRRRREAGQEQSGLQQVLVDAGGYQEFVAGTIPLKAVLGLAASGRSSGVLIQHQRGYLAGFDEHLDRVRDGDAPAGDVDYDATWAAISGTEKRPAIVRLELRVLGLNCRPRLTFTGLDILSLWLLVDGAELQLNLDPPDAINELPFAPAWGLGAAPGADFLARLLTILDVPPPPSVRER
jgi:hypothetical protein